MNVQKQRATAKNTPLNFNDRTSRATAGQYNEVQKAPKMAEI